ncbi:response regulator [Pontibacter diazotrophicus]|uniref:histidine kinase n=1 Tax=Pontibacter diazotrophicus TaxID=1400979 RepID=A0A3D8LH36_9BACT|nr:ATP-binding protein [Pontibacter diazotrophicus]RDV16678.1 response regulator [Pontibacter diazotrophicus]
MKLTTLPIKESTHIKESLSYKIGESGSERDYDSAMELPSEIVPPSVRFTSFAGYCKQWFKLILGFTTNDSASNHSGNMKAIKLRDTEEAVFFDSSFNSVVRKNANVQFNHMFPLKASDENSDGASGLLDTRKKHQSLRKGIYTQRDKDRKKTFEPHGLKVEEPAKPEHSEAGALRAETEQIARICSWEYTVEAQKFFCTEFVHTLLRIPTGDTVSSFLSLLQYFAEEDRSKLSHSWSQALSSGKALNYVTRLGHVQESIWIRLIMKPVYKNNRLLKVIGTLQDVTDCIKTEMQLIAEKEKAEQTTKAKSEFVSLMSHEIRTPLNAIMGLTYLLLQEENMAHEHKENLQSIHFSSQNMLTLINNTLDFSRIEAGKIELEKVNFQLTDLLKKINRSLSIRASEKNLSLVLNIGEDTPSEVAGDPARLTQVLNNLMSNAIKFTKSGSVTLTVEVVYQSDDDWVLEFTVKDTGVGIPADRQQQIFESFVQASAATHRQYGGTGLGLAITKKIVELQNGSIQLKSTPGEGSEFTVRLRFLKPDISLDSLKVIEQAEKSESTLKDVKVLVIDDNIINNLVASKLLISWQAEVDTAADGFAAIEKIKATNYDLVLMDLHMPVMNGFDAIAEIRSLGYTLPIIALTANANEDEKKRIIALGGNDYITKPFVPQELHDKIQEHLQPVCC